jgi:hypothetical protein
METLRTGHEERARVGAGVPPNQVILGNILAAVMEFQLE